MFDCVYCALCNDDRQPHSDAWNKIQWSDSRLYMKAACGQKAIKQLTTNGCVKPVEHGATIFKYSE